MKTYPIYLTGMERGQAIVIGGGDVAARKVKDLLEAGAHVTLISPSLMPELQGLADARRIAVINRPYQEGDLSGAFLGCVDISTQPDESPDKAQESKIVFGKLLEARKDTAIMLDFADETLNQMTLSVQICIVVPLWLTISTGRDDGDSAAFNYDLKKIDGVV